MLVVKLASLIALVAIFFTTSALCGQTTSPSSRPSGSPETRLRQPQSAKEIMAAIKPGMTEAEVSRVIEERRPGEEWSDPSSISANDSNSRYELGNGNYLILDFGKVQDPLGNIQADDKVRSAKLCNFDDLKSKVGDDLFPLVKLIHLSPSPCGVGFNPASLIRVVNVLRAEGKEKALRSLKRYEEIASYHSGTDEEFRQTGELRFDYDLDEQRIFLITRLLFVRTDGDERMPWLLIGSASPEVEADREDDDHIFAPKDWPVFPLVVQDDIPFCMVNGYSLAGRAEPPSRHLDFCEHFCKLRDRDLKPSATPIVAVERACDSSQWHRLFKTREDDGLSRYLLRTQALRCAASAYGEVVTEDTDLHPNCVSDEQADRTWTAWTQVPRLQHVRWDKRSQRFAAGE